MNIHVLRRVNALRLLSLAIVISFSFSMCAVERILSWDSDVTIRHDSSMRIIEQITVNAQGKQIKHGIKREFPTRYKDSWGFRYNVGFDLVEVLLDGKKVPYQRSDHINGICLYIGDQHHQVNPGTHHYTITYDTNRQLGFFENYDELHWNVTGLGWPFSIDAVKVHVHIPTTKLDGNKVSSDAVHAEAYTGTFGQKGQDYHVSVEPDGTVQFSMTRILWPHEGLTIVVNWPKGIVRQHYNFWYYMMDNLHLLILLLILILLCLWYAWVYFITRRRIKYGTVIPLFHPPYDADPGSLRYVLKMGYDRTCLASSIVHMAVRGLIIIEHVPGRLFSKAHYILKRRTDISVNPTEFESRFMSTCFGRSDTLALTKENQECLSLASNLLANNYERSYAIPYFNTNSDYVGIGGLITLIAALIAGFSVPQAYADVWFWLLVLAQLLVHGSMYVVLPTYTQAGQKFKEQVDGFKMFLTTTETERLKVIGTPPTKTPELFEKYLPYAIALDVEKQWSEQFASVFKELEYAGHPYQPVWYYAGHAFMYHDLMLLSTGLGNSLEGALSSALTPISSSISRPGSSSGSGGGGYSGGGGGGGGGGGW